MKFSAFIAAILLTVGLISCGDKKDDGAMGDTTKTEVPAAQPETTTPPPATPPPATGDTTHMDTTHK